MSLAGVKWTKLKKIIYFKYIRDTAVTIVPIQQLLTLIGILSDYKGIT